MNNNLDQALDYVIIPRRNFTRYVLTYEVLPLSLCCTIDNQHITTWEAVTLLHREETIDDSFIVLGLEKSSTKQTSFVSFSKIKVVLFSTITALKDCLDKRLPNNFDITRLSTKVIGTEELNSTCPAPTLLSPEKVDKHTLTQKLVESDALTALAHQMYVNHAFDVASITVSRDKDEVLRQLLPLDKSDPYLEIAVDFFKLCTVFNLDKGWDLEAILNHFKTHSSDTSKELELFKPWIEIATKIVNNTASALHFTDEDNIILRAMTLVLYNPLVEQIIAFKQNKGELVGDKVAEIAQIFASARIGYSYLSTEERDKVGDYRKSLQEFNASIHQPEADIIAANIDDTKDQAVGEFSTFTLADHDFLTPEPDSELKRCSVYRMVGVKPMSGFDLALLEQEDSRLALRIIDMSDDKGRKKLTNKLAMDLIKLQKALPSTECRFEVDDEYGALLRLPPQWSTDPELKQHLSQLLELMSPLGIKYKNSNLI